MRYRPDPELSTSSHRLQVRFCETDLMGIAHHSSYLLYCEAGRVDWLRKRGASYEAWMEYGVQLPVVEAKVRFKKAARFDEILEVETVLSEVSRVTVRFAYQVRSGSSVLCEAETLLACVDGDLKLRRIPAEIGEVLRRPELPVAERPPGL